MSNPSQVLIHFISTTKLACKKVLCIPPFKGGILVDTPWFQISHFVLVVKQQRGLFGVSAVRRPLGRLKKKKEREKEIGKGPVFLNF